jgi:acyl-CoA synthetase (NDP forming)
MTRLAKDLRPLLEPRSVAVIGASQKGGRATGAVQNLLDLGFTGAIHPVNRNYDTVLGLRCYPSVGAIPTDVDLVAIGIPGAAALQELRAAHAKGVAPPSCSRAVLRKRASRARRCSRSLPRSPPRAAC